jgi:hypothetical protein
VYSERVELRGPNDAPVEAREIFPESIFAMSDPSRAHVRCRREKALVRYAAENHIAYCVPQYEELVRRNGPTNVSSLPQFAGDLFAIITDGAFDGFGGVIVRERSIERIVVSISFIRRSVAAEVNRDAIRPLTAKRNA